MHRTPTLVLSSNLVLLNDMIYTQMFYVMYTISSIWHILEQYHINTKTAKQSSLNTLVKSTCLNTKTKTYVIERLLFQRT